MMGKFYFIGVSTTDSLIMQIFPQWMERLGHPEVAITGIDLPIHADPEKYRDIIGRMKADVQCLGGLVTTHKVDLYRATSDLFDYLDPYAQICAEVSSVSKILGRLEGHAKDPISSGLSLRAIVGKGYFRLTAGQVLCLGAGGAAEALLLSLILQEDASDRPRRFILVDRLEERLTRVKEMAARQGTDIQVETIQNEDPKKNDELMAALPAGSLVINATGMGKDLPGSPVTPEGVFPYEGIAWEFNYRGKLDFLRQAIAQRELRKLTIADGWTYFLYGWTQVIAQVLHLSISEAQFEELARIADKTRKAQLISK